MIYSLYIDFSENVLSQEKDFLLSAALPLDPKYNLLLGSFMSDELAGTRKADAIIGDFVSIPAFTDENTPDDQRSGLTFIFGDDLANGFNAGDLLVGDGYSFSFTVDHNLTQNNNFLFSGSDVLEGGNGTDIIVGDFVREASIVYQFPIFFSGDPDNPYGISEFYAADTLLGGNGDDVLIGDEGVRSAVGTFTFHALYFGDDDLDGGKGNDVLVGDNSGVILKVITEAEAGGKESGSMENLLFQFGNDELNGGLGDDLLIGDVDLISLGLIGDPDVLGSDGNPLEVRDNIFLMGHDIINGGLGDDIIYGDLRTFENPFGWSNDLIGGNDVLTGGPGMDIFSYIGTIDNGHDIITDYSQGDKLVLTDGANVQSTSFNGQGDLVMHLANTSMEEIGTVTLLDITDINAVTIEHF